MFVKNTASIQISLIKIKSDLVKRVWEYLDRKFGTVYLTTLNLQNILNLSKLLSETGTVLSIGV